jgi:outer membrane protein assembly factor BamB
VFLGLKQLNWKAILCLLIAFLLLCGPNLIVASLFSKNSASSLNSTHQVKANLEYPHVKAHKITDAELAELKSEEGVSVKGQNYNQPITGYVTDGGPPTAEEWVQIASNAYMVDSIMSQEPLPTSVDNSKTPWFPPIGVQGHGCNAFSVGYYTKTFLEAKEHGWDLSGARWEGHSGSSVGYPTPSYQDKIMSPAFVYNLCEWSGAIESTMNVVLNVGDCTWKTMPYVADNYTLWPSEQAWTEAAYYRGDSSRGYQYIDLTTDEGLTNLKNWLASQNLASILVDGGHKLNRATLTSADFLTLDNYVNPIIDHVNTIVGYDDTVSYVENGTTRYGGFKIANSWGTGGWENVADGFYWISYEAMKQRFRPCLFYYDLIDYKPTLTATFRIVHDKRSDCTIVVGLGSVSAPTATKSFSSFVSGYPYPYSRSDYLPFPDNNIVFDITEFESYISSIYGQTFWLSVYDGDSTATGIITSFSINSSGCCQESANAPNPTINGRYVYSYVNYPTAANLMMFPTLGPAGREITLQGSGFTAKGSATLSYLNPINSEWLPIDSNVTVSDSGTINYRWVVPDLLRDNSAGDHSPLSDAIVFRAQDNTGGFSYDTAVPYSEMRRGLARVGNAVAAGLFGNNTDLSSIVSAVIGKTFTLTGCWFQPGGLTVFWDSTVVWSNAVAVDRGGVFNIVFVVPSTSNGMHTIRLANGDATFGVNVKATGTTSAPVAPIFTVANGVVYVASAGVICAFEANSGVLQWSDTTAISVNCMVAGGSALYLGSADGVSAISVGSRATLWSMSSSYYKPAYALTFADGILCESTSAGRFQVINTNTGQLVIGGSYGSLASCCVIANESVYFALQDGRLGAYRVPATFAWQLDDYYRVASWSSLALDNGLLFASSANSVYAFNASNGNFACSSTFGTDGNISSLAAANGRVYLGLGSQIYALIGSNGSLLGFKDMGGAVSSLTIASGVIYAGVGSQVVAIDASTELFADVAILWSYPTNGTISSLVVSNDLVYASSKDGNLYAIDVSNGKKLWSYLAAQNPEPSPPPPSSSPSSSTQVTTSSSSSTSKSTPPSTPAPTPTPTITPSPAETPTPAPTSSPTPAPANVIIYTFATVGSIGAAMAIALALKKRRR